MRSSTEAVNKVWAHFSKMMDVQQCGIDVMWQSRESADAKLSDLLSRCPSSPLAMQEYRSQACQPKAVRCQIQPSVRQLIQA